MTERDSTSYTYSADGLFNHLYFYRDDIKNYKLMNYEGKLSGKIMFNQNNNSKIGIYIKRSYLDYVRTLAKFWSTYNNTDHNPDTINTITMPSDLESNSVQVFNANAYKMGAFITHVWQVSPKLALNLGIRGDYFEMNRELDISPRTNLSYAILPDLKVSAAWGIFYQSPMMKQLKYSYSTPENTKSQKATHYLLGIEKKMRQFTFKMEAYYKRYDQLLPLERTSLGEIIYDVKENRANGYSTGVDLECVITRKSFDFWLNYSLGSAKERLNGTSHYYSRYSDQRHTISSMVLFRMIRRNELSFKMTYGSGYAFQSLFYDATAKQWSDNGEITSSHLPYYLSIDLRYQKEFRLYSRPLRFYMDLMNVLNRKNIIGHRYGVNYDGPFEENTSYLGILPTFGLIFDF
jgi:outer membrane cobalamin receptor